MVRVDHDVYRQTMMGRTPYHSMPNPPGADDGNDETNIYVYV